MKNTFIYIKHLIVWGGLFFCLCFCLNKDVEFNFYGPHSRTYICNYFNIDTTNLSESNNYYIVNFYNNTHEQIFVPARDSFLCYLTKSVMFTSKHETYYSIIDRPPLAFLKQIEIPPNSSRDFFCALLLPDTIGSIQITLEYTKNKNIMRKYSISKEFYIKNDTLFAIK